MKENLKYYFLTSRTIFKSSSLVREPKKQFLWDKNGNVLFFTSHGTGFTPKTWKKLSSVKIERPIGHRGGSTKSGKCLTEAVKWEVET